jgi:hypothetical protein
MLDNDDHHVANRDRSDLESDSDSESEPESEALLEFPCASTMQSTEIHEDHNDISDVEVEEDYIPLPGALTSLRKELLGDYKCPESPPHSPPIYQHLTSAQMLSLKHYVAWKKSNGTVNAFNTHAAVLKDATGQDILSLHNCQKLVIQLTDLQAHKVDICPNSCIAYTGKYDDKTSCPYVKEGKICGLSRYGKKSKPNAQMMCLPIMPTIKAMFANEDTARLLRYRDKCLQEALHVVANATQTYSDFRNSKVHQEHHNRGLFKDPRDIAFAISTDGAQLTMQIPGWLS